MYYHWALFGTVRFMGLAMSGGRSYTYKTGVGYRMRADVYRPSGIAKSPQGSGLPAILWIHGGALVMGNRKSLPQYQRNRYVDAGYVVIAIDYRLAPEVKIPDIISDIQDAYRWVRKAGPRLFGIDPDRIVVVGHSAGGYLTLMAGVRFDPRPKALISFYGYGDIVGAWYSEPDDFYSRRPAVPRAEAYRAVKTRTLTGTSGRGSRFVGRSRFYLYCRQNGLWPLEVCGHDPKTEVEWFSTYCPVRQVSRTYPPTLLIHGDMDTDVPVQQSQQMAEALEANAVPYQLLILPGEGHGFDAKGPADSSVSRAFDRVFSFLTSYAQE